MARYEGEPEAAVVADVARQTAGVKHTQVKPDVEKILLVRELTGLDTDQVRVLSMEKFAPAPYRRRGTALFDDPASLVLYVNTFKAEGLARLYASLAKRQAVVVLNDDDPADNDSADTIGAWRDHRAELAVRATPEWERWRAMDSKLVGQTDFAEHLELNLADIVEPVAADLVEIARSFTASTDVQFRSAVNLQSGETRFAYDENTTAQATSSGGSTIDVPRTFALRIAVFQGTEPLDVTARLRYRLHGGHLTIGYLLDKADDIERNAFQNEIEDVAKDVGLVALYGQSPMPPSSPA